MCVVRGWHWLRGCMVAWLPVSHGCGVRGVRGCTAVCGACGVCGVAAWLCSCVVSELRGFVASWCAWCVWLHASDVRGCVQVVCLVCLVCVVRCCVVRGALLRGVRDVRCAWLALAAWCVVRGVCGFVVRGGCVWCAWCVWCVAAWCVVHCCVGCVMCVVRGWH